jgi:hypothetical protein
MSSILANGTRVTGSAPTQLGQYRSYLRNASALTYTETNGSPTAPPTSIDGIKIYNGNTWGSSDNNNEPTRYEIFIGKNKNFKIETYASSGRTGFADITPSNLNGNIERGYFTSYDPSNGIFTITANREGGSNGVVHQSAMGQDGNNSVSDIYFDVIVSENALAVGVQSPRSEIYVYGGNGLGGTATKIRRYTTTGTSLGNAVTYADSAANGASFTINETGVYTLAVSASMATPGEIGFSKNSTQLTTNLSSITAADRLAITASQVSGYAGAVTITTNLNAGDVIRPHSDSSADAGGASTYSWFRITKVSN